MLRMAAPNGMRVPVVEVSLASRARGEADARAKGLEGGSLGLREC